MSQIQTFGFGSGPLPPTVLSKLTGDLGGPVGPTGNNINILGTTGNPIVPLGPNAYILGEIQGNPGSSTLFVTPYTVDTNTVGAVTSTLYSLTIPANQAVVIRATIIAQNLALSACAGGDIVVIGRNPGGAGVIATSGGSGIVTDYVGNPPPLVIGTSAGNDLIIQVTGVAGQTWDWTAAIIYTFQF